MKWVSSIMFFYMKINDKTKNSLHNVYKWSKHYHMVSNKIILLDLIIMTHVANFKIYYVISQGL